MLSKVPGQRRDDQQRDHAGDDDAAQKGRSAGRWRGFGDIDAPEDEHEPDKAQERRHHRQQTPAGIGVDAQTGRDAQANPRSPAPGAPGAPEGPQDQHQEQRHQDRLDPHAAENDVPAHDRQGDRREPRRGHREPPIGQRQLAAQAEQRGHGQCADQRCHPAHHRGRLAEQPERYTRQVNEHRLDAEVAGEEDRTIAGLGHHPPCFQRLVGLIEMEAGRDIGEPPEAESGGQGRDQGQSRRIAPKPARQAGSAHNRQPISEPPDPPEWPPPRPPSRRCVPRSRRPPSDPPRSARSRPSRRR